MGSRLWAGPCVRCSGGASLRILWFAFRQLEEFGNCCWARRTRVETLSVPYAPIERRLRIEAIGDDFHRVLIRFGFMETPDVPLALMRSCDAGGIHFDPMETTYFASRETVVAIAHRGMPVWRDKLFAVMHRNAAPATGFFRIPGNRLVELGAQVEI